MLLWVDVMGVDGFRFDLGWTWVRNDHDSHPAPLLQAILQGPYFEPNLPSDGAWGYWTNGYQVGQFPKGFLECNDKYRDTIPSLLAPEMMDLYLSFSNVFYGIKRSFSKRA